MGHILTYEIGHEISVRTTLSYAGKHLLAALALVIVHVTYTV